MIEDYELQFKDKLADRMQKSKLEISFETVNSNKQTANLTYNQRVQKMIDRYQEPVHLNIQDEPNIKTENSKENTMFSFGGDK